MTRKKFIKQLMGRYYMDRNRAASIAKSVQLRGWPYKEALSRCEAVIHYFVVRFNLPYCFMERRPIRPLKAKAAHEIPHPQFCIIGEWEELEEHFQEETA